MAWTIEYRQPVRKTIDKLDPVIRRRIKQFLEERLAKHDNPRSFGDPLQGSKLGAYWRYTVGDYRIICDIQDGKLIVLVVEIGHRSSVYR
ncbi:type II toxin-antitoxin system RelE family toxin [Rhizobium rhizophilum]|uniref:Type II toxin-antitoxin system RelE/ParE family toxin n=1 Tax=Rhizobium rhizophilum TaxID=1850373 RepID=A0ABY2R0F6_9HYPH|nr:type II toxin-antitoxin system RelE/ParE family toxin [Rhizobium rhizophilum]THV16669.1 type II toxin-antitoxin system RelE/ParE family toxin [Rhizobium rhizophilum]